MGLEPDGSAVPVQTEAARALVAAQMRPWTRREALRTVSFWSLLLAFLLVLIAQTGYMVHQVTFLQERLGSRSEAAFTISVTALGSILARLVVGIFADGIDRRLLSAVLFVVQGTCVLVIVHVDNVLATWLLTLVFGFTIGNVYMMQSLLASEIFGMVSFGTVFGLISFAGQTGSGLGPIGVGLLHDASDSYVVPFTVCAVLTYVAAAVVLLARPVVRTEELSADLPSARAAAPSPGGR
jgi:MFS family permease